MPLQFGGPFTPPAGNAANLGWAVPAPPGDANLQFGGPYVPPAGDNANLGWAPPPPPIPPATLTLTGRLSGLRGSIAMHRGAMLAVAGQLSGLRGSAMVLTIPDVDIAGQLSGLRGVVFMRQGATANIAGRLSGLRTATAIPKRVSCARAMAPEIEILGDDAALAVRIVQQWHAPASLADGLTVPALLSIGTIQRSLSIPGLAPAPTPNMDATLDNGAGQITRLFGATPPVRRSARVLAGAGVAFSGVVTALELGEQARLTMEAGSSRPLSESVPLRTTAVWGGWRNIQTIPWAYGRVTLTPIQYEQDQRLFVLADHPVAEVVEVLRDDVPTSAFAWYNGTDSTGRAVSFLELAMPLSDGERIAVTVLGRMHPESGQALQSPAEIAHDLLANLVGAPVAWPDFDDYRAETAHLQIGGLVVDNGKSSRATVDELMQSTGSAWAAAMPGVALLWPPAPQDDAAVLPVTQLSAGNMRASTDATGLATAVRVLYDYDHAAQRYRKAVQVHAPEAESEWGVIEAEWPAPWLRTARDAEALGRRMLGQLARPRWRVSFELPFSDVQTGSWVHLQHPLSPLTGPHRLVGTEIDTAGAVVRCTVEAAVGSAPDIEVQQSSTAFDPLIQPGITVDIGAGEIIFTALDEQGRPLAGAKITLDGKASRIADSAGRVSFPAARGRHMLLVEAQGYPPSEVEVVI